MHIICSNSVTNVLRDCNFAIEENGAKMDNATQCLLSASQCILYIDYRPILGCDHIYFKSRFYLLSNSNLQYIVSYL